MRNNGVMRWFTKSSSLPADLTAELRRLRPEAGRVLAVGRAAGMTVAGCTECLALHREAPGAGEQQWQFIGWHLVTRGGWNQQSNELRWTLVDDTHGSVILEEPGALPDVFRDRVRASIVVEQSFVAPGGGHVVVAGRRRLGVEGPIVWQVTTLGSARLTTPEVAEFATARVADMRLDYGG